MILPSPLVQVIAALLIFVVGFLMVFFSTVLCLGIAILVCKGALFLESYVMTMMRRVRSPSRNAAPVTRHMATPAGRL